MNYKVIMTQRRPTIHFLAPLRIAEMVGGDIRGVCGVDIPSKSSWAGEIGDQMGVPESDYVETLFQDAPIGYKVKYISVEGRDFYI